METGLQDSSQKVEKDMNAKRDFRPLQYPAVFLAICGWLLFWSNLHIRIVLKPSDPPPVNATIQIGEGRMHLFGEEAYYRYPAFRLAELSQQRTTIVYCVLASAPLKERRDLIRKTWARNAKTVFFGVSGDFDLVKDEFLKYQDMIWVGQDETYNLLVWKTQGLFHAITRHLPTVKYIWKTDDDVYVNVNMLEGEMFDASKNGKNGLLGDCKSTVEVIRDPENKWYVPESAFSGTFFPPYSERTYAVSRELCECMMGFGPSLPFIAPEDALSGILADKCNTGCGTVPWLSVDRFDSYNENVTLTFHAGKQIIGSVLEAYFTEIHRRSCELRNAYSESCP